jgi:glycosyltransferase involved in cell wall biosynthesis
MRVLVNTDHVQPEGGLARSVFEVTEGLAARGHEMHLLHLAGGALLDGYRDACRSVRRVRRWWPDPEHRVRSSGDVARAVAAGVRVHADIVHTHRYRHTPWAATVARLSGASLVCHLREHPPQRFTRAWQVGVSQVTRFIAVSAAIRDEYVAAGLPAARVDVVPTGVDTDRWRLVDADERRALRAAAGVPEDAFVAVYAGRIDPEKGPDVLVDAWARLGWPPEDARLVVAGDIRGRFAAGEGPAYLAALQGALPPGSGAWLGACADMMPVYGLADVVVVPSRAEAFGRAVVEGLAVGHPVVATRVGGTPEILSGELAIGLVDAEDPEALADGLARMRDLGVSGRDSLGGLGRGHVVEHFSQHAMLDGIEATLRTAAAGRRRLIASRDVE